MTLRKYNDTPDDADNRPISIWYCERLNTQENLLSNNLKRAHDAYDMEQERKRLAELGIDILEIQKILRDR